MKVGIVGGGIMGIGLGYFLSKKGFAVEIYEASPALGGLVGSITIGDGTKVDRFYHAILSSDKHLRQLCEEVGIADRLRFKETRMGFFYRGKIYSMNNIIEFLRFPPLGWVDRLRLGFTVLIAQCIRDWHKLENISVDEWLIRLGGRHTYENIWLPLLRAKFDGDFDNTPATYIWARLVRMKSTRGGASQKEEAGHIIGGYSSLVDAMAERIQTMDGVIHLHAPVNKIVIDHDKAVGLQVDNEIQQFDKIISTVQLPIFHRLIPGANNSYQEFISHIEYLGIICPLMVLDRPLTGYWTLNLTDEELPFTGIIETTSYIDPQYVGGHYLVYLPKYTSPNSPFQEMADKEIKERWLVHLESMMPEFDRGWIRYFSVQRERFVEPLHPLNGTHLIPQIQTPLENLYLATNSQIYPALTNVESICKKAKEVSELIENHV
jgi:protoporphyrinogen oxidase